MKRNGLLILLLLSVGLNLGLGYRIWRGSTTETVSTTVRAGERNRPFPHDEPDSLWQRGMMDRRLRHMSRALDLRPEQVDALRVIQRQNEGQVRRGGRELFEMRRQMREAMMSQQPDQEQVRRLIQAMGRHQARLDSLVTETILREMAVLDPGQRRAYIDLLPMGGGGFGGPARGRGPRRGQ